jgi:hypothetical protein
MTTSVVHIRDGYDVYIGRGGQGEQGPFGNPFKQSETIPCRRCKKIHDTKASTLPCYRDWFQDRVLRTLPSAAIWSS